MSDGDETETCPKCDTAEYVETEEDKYCPNCYYAPEGSQASRTLTNQSAWSRWHEHREQYSGWFGSDRVRFVGGFLGCWDFGEDGYL